MTDDEFKRAHEPMVSDAQKTSRDNNYWLTGVLIRAQERPEWLDWARTRVSDIEAITRSEISELAAKYLGRDRASRAIILPRGKASPQPAPAESSGK